MTFSNSSRLVVGILIVLAVSACGQKLEPWPTGYAFEQLGTAMNEVNAKRAVVAVNLGGTIDKCAAFRKKVEALKPKGYALFQFKQYSESVGSHIMDPRKLGCAAFRADSPKDGGVPDMMTLSLDITQGDLP